MTSSLLRIARPGPHQARCWAYVALLLLGGAPAARAAEPTVAAAPGTRLVVDLARAPGSTIVIPGRPASIDLAAPICGFAGPDGVVAGTSPSALAFDPLRYQPGWLEVQVAWPDSPDCARARLVRLFVGAGDATAEPPAAVSIQAESRVAEFTAGDVAPFVAVAVRAGEARAVEPCVSGQTCSLVVPDGFIRAWLRREPVGLLLWPKAVPLAPGEDVPVVLVGHDTYVSWTQRLVSNVDVVFGRPLVQSDTVNVAAERGFLPLVVPEAVAAVRCRRARCALKSDGVEIYAVEPAALAVQVALTLRDGCVRQSAEGRPAETAEVVEVGLARCAMQPAAPVPLIAGVQNHRYFVALSRQCFDAPAETLLVTTQPPTPVYVRSESPGADAAWRLIELVFERVPEGAGQLDLTLARRAPDRTTLGLVRLPVSDGFAPERIRFELPELGPVDFIPTNREAQVELTYGAPCWERDVRLQSRRGYYTVHEGSPRGQTVRAPHGAQGAVALRFAYVPHELAQVLGREESLVQFDSDARYSLRQVNLPLPLNAAGAGATPLVRLLCRTGANELAVPTGKTVRIPFAERDSCRILIDRGAIPVEAGEQRLRVTAGEFQEIVSVVHQPGVIVIALPAGSRNEFDPLAVAVGHEYSGGHYDLSSRHNIGPEVSYRVILGDRRVRISAGTALPTGLFRFGSKGERNAITLSAGVAARLVVLYKEGKEFPIGFEIGVLGTGLSDTPHLSVVSGIGFSIPVLNPNTSLQTSFNIHAWAEYSPTRGGDKEGQWAFIFGPSFSVGKFAVSL